MRRSLPLLICLTTLLLAMGVRLAPAISHAHQNQPPHPGPSPMPALPLLPPIGQERLDWTRLDDLLQQPGSQWANPKGAIASLIRARLAPQLRQQWPSNGPHQDQAKTFLLAQLSGLPTEVLAKLTVLDDAGLLRLPCRRANPPELTLSEILLTRAAQADVALPVFDFLLQQSSVTGFHDADLLQTVIEHGNTAKLQHALDAGLDPSKWDTLGLAKSMGRPDISQILRVALAKRGKPVK
jgi:hypothetical protein